MTDNRQNAPISADNGELNRLRHLAAQLSGILAIAADAIISVDQDLRISLFNDGAEAIFGWTRSEVLGKPLDLLLPERYRRAHSGHVRTFGAAATTARKMADRQPIFGLRKDGSEFPAEASISRLDVNGQRTFTVVLRDVTERQRAQDLLAQSHAELEQRVAERTAELSAEIRRREETQAALVRTQRMEAFGQLTGGIAHDFNNLLTVITGNLELLDMRLEDERARTLLKRAQDSAEMGARLTSRLLTFARRRQLETAALNLNDQVMGMVELLRRTLGEHIDLTTRLEPKLWTVSADPSEIENAVLNLAINSRDAMPKGGRLIIETANVVADEDQIGAITKVPAGEYVRVAISDTGSGMAPDVLQHAFEPFFTTKAPGKGTGLGLSTIYGFVQQLGGTATIYSEVGRGTTVNLYLPRSKTAYPARAEMPSAAQIPKASGETVLLVEDNDDVREVTRSRLQDLGYTVVEAVNGHGALQVLQSGELIDIVFSDVVMPGGLSGFDVARWVRTERPAMAMLLTSGYAEDVLRSQESEIPGLRILRKPYNKSELARALRQSLER
ncbi:MAG TPA: PAS domain S-box protein [Hyphomicrobiaceae bacterium]|nr:PAS domain S-box protein [Hyphomicrobiaceae bacterium]